MIIIPDTRIGGAVASPGFPHLSGISLKPRYYEPLLRERPDVGFLELHAENYLSPGGPARHYLDLLAEHYPLSVHGVGLSIGGETLNTEHLRRVAKLVDRLQPMVFSEHLAWSSHNGNFFNDLLPLPYTRATLRHVCAHIDQVQEYLGRPILLENPATYVQFGEQDFTETEFLSAIIDRTGCELLLDINNVEVACFNRREDPYQYLRRFPLRAVRQIHLAGHATDSSTRPTIKIDGHDRPVCETVWRLYRHVLIEHGDCPTLIEWDSNLPDLATLLQQARHADDVRAQVQMLESHHVCAV